MQFKFKAECYECKRIHLSFSKAYLKKIIVVKNIFFGFEW